MGNDVYFSVIVNEKNNKHAQVTCNIVSCVVRCALFISARVPRVASS